MFLVQQRRRHKERKHHRRTDAYASSAGGDDLMDTPTFKRFNMALDGVLDAAEDLNLRDIRGVCVAS